MKAMLLAAGRGKRMRPLTDDTPKPLLKVGDSTLIGKHVRALHDSGIRDIVINIAWLGEQIRESLGSGDCYGVNIDYSDEGVHALETAGGIINALPILGDNPFLVVNSDIWTDFDFSCVRALSPGKQAHLLLVENPQHNPAGDFSLSGTQVMASGEHMFTFSGIALYSPQFFEGVDPGKTPLAPMLKNRIEQGVVSGEIMSGEWFDVGSIERLKHLRSVITR